MPNDWRITALHRRASGPQMFTWHYFFLRPYGAVHDRLRRVEHPVLRGPRPGSRPTAEGLVPRCRRPRFTGGVMRLLDGNIL